MKFAKPALFVFVFAAVIAFMVYQMTVNHGYL